MKIRWIGALENDPCVIGVARLGMEGGGQKLLRDLSERLGLNGGAEEATLEVVKQRRGQRATIRVDAGKAGRYFLKLLRSARGERRIAETNRIADAAEEVGVIVPRPIAWLPRFRAIVTGQIEGERLLGEPIREGDPDSMRATGRALAHIHATLQRPTLVSVRAFERERVMIALAAMEENHPATLPMFEREVVRWRSDEPDGPEEIVGIHGDFYPDQVLLHARGRIAILDWDNVCSGEAERDAGNFVAHVILEGERDTLHETTTLVAAFLGGYALAMEGRLRPAVLAWYAAGSLLRLSALHADPAFGSLPPNDPELPGRLIHRARAITGGSLPGIIGQ